MMETLFWLIGSIGSVSFAVCYLPQIIHTIKAKTADGLSAGLLWMNVVGNVCCCSFVLSVNLRTGVWQYPLYFNYGTALILNIVMLILIRKYRRPT